MTSQTDVRAPSFTSTVLDRITTLGGKAAKGIAALDLGTKAKRVSKYTADRMRGLSGKPSPQRLGLYLSRLSDRELAILGLERDRLFGEIEARFRDEATPSTDDTADQKTSA